jgi:hypothetical protein
MRAMLVQHLSTLTLQTHGRGLIEITGEVRTRVAESGIGQGLLTLFVRHTSASLLGPAHTVFDRCVASQKGQVLGAARE